MAEKRLYVGNLPNDTTERDLQSFFKKYGASTIELKKKPGALQESTFAYVNVSADRVNDCLEKCRSKNFKNTTLKIEIAKESFLERLKKERDKRNEKSSSENTSSNFPSVSNVARKNKKIVFTDDQDSNLSHAESSSSQNMVKPKKRKSAANDSKFDRENDHSNFPPCEIEKRKSPAKNFGFKNDSYSPVSKVKNQKSVENSEIADESDHSADEVPWKRNLPMFRGTASVSFEEPKVDFSMKRFEEPKADFSMKRFEEFSDVWRDSSPDRGANQRKLKWKWKESGVDLQENNVTASSESNLTKSSSKDAAELKRKNALQEKWNVIKEKKETIRKALKNLETNRKKTKFSEPINEEERDIVETSGHKVTLFEDDASDDDFQPNFDVRENLTEKNGFKMLKLKSKLSNDERFKLDDRFYEDIEEDSPSNRLIESEKQKKSIQQRSMIRYDPDDPEHKKFEKQQIQSKASEKKKKVKKKPDKNQTAEETAEKNEIPKPEVSKEKHYSVTDALKDAFKKSDEKASFSLSAMFDEKIQKDKKRVDNTDAEAVPLKKLKTIENPFEGASSTDDEPDEVTIEEEEPLNVRLDSVASEKVLGKCGVWGETFFFKANDSRLQEAVSFYRVSSKPKRMDFDKARSKLKSIVRKKLQNSRRDTRLFKQKLGGKLNKAKFQKRLKKARS